MAVGIRLVSKILSSVLVVAVVLMAVLLVGVRLVGFTPYTVLSGSMEPNYHVGSIIYVSKVDPTELKVKDPITYKMPNGTIVTHRIVEILNEDKPSELAFKTKGDANEVVDGTPVPAAAVIGKAKFSIPYLGYVSDFIKKPQGLFIIVAICLLVVILSVLTDMLFPKQKKDEQNEEQEQKAENP